MGELTQEIPSQAVHLCIDMQRIFSREGPWPAPWMERVLPNVVDLVGCAPERTVFTRFITPQRPSDLPGTWATYYKKWRETTRERLDPRLLNLVPELERFVRLRACSTSEFTRLSPTAGCIRSCGAVDATR